MMKERLQQNHHALSDRCKATDDIVIKRMGVALTSAQPFHSSRASQNDVLVESRKHRAGGTQGPPCLPPQLYSLNSETTLI